MLVQTTLAHPLGDTVFQPVGSPADIQSLQAMLDVAVELAKQLSEADLRSKPQGWSAIRYGAAIRLSALQATVFPDWSTFMSAELNRNAFVITEPPVYRANQEVGVAFSLADREPGQYPQVRATIWTWGHPRTVTVWWPELQIFGTHHLDEGLTEVLEPPNALKTPSGDLKVFTAKPHTSQVRGTLEQLGPITDRHPDLSTTGIVKPLSLIFPVLSAGDRALLLDPYHDALAGTITPLGILRSQGYAALPVSPGRLGPVIENDAAVVAQLRRGEYILVLPESTVDWAREQTGTPAL